MFRIKIALLSVLISGLVLVGFGLYSFSVMKKVNMERIDREILTLGQGHLTIGPPRGYWQNFEQSLGFIYREGRPENAQQYSIEQAISDQAQLHTIAFSGLAFITGNYGAATFIPPGKVCDFFGFQYMRDIDVARKGHNPIFLNRVAGNVLYTLNRTLTAEQRRFLMKLRGLEGYTSAPAYIYSTPVREEIKLPNTDHFFFSNVKLARGTK